jgi:hypothetical protein
MKKNIPYSVFQLKSRCPQVTITIKPSQSSPPPVSTFLSHLDVEIAWEPKLL